VFGWLAYWREARDPAALADAPRSSQPRVLKVAHRARLEQFLDEQPEAYGYKTISWTVPLLVIHFAEGEGVPVSDTTLRRVLHVLGYAGSGPSTCSPGAVRSRRG
jgi:transposase